MKHLLIALSVVFSVSAMAQSKATLKLLQAVDNNDLKSAQSAIKEGADVNGSNNNSAPSTTVLLKAVKFNRVEITKLLLDNHADINQRRPIDMYSPLMVAAKLNHAKIASMLIAKGADVSLTTVIGRNALHLAALSNSVEVAKLLVQTNIDVNARPEVCALAVAARQDHRQIVSLLKNLSGSKAPSAVCLERAIDMADFNEHVEVLKILRG